jgi:hypothetical protein
MRFLLVPVVVAFAVSTAASQEPLPTKEALIARAKSFELDTPYVPPPGDPLEHHTSGFAKIIRGHLDNLIFSGLFTPGPQCSTGKFSVPLAFFTAWSVSTLEGSGCGTRACGF